MHAVSWIPSLLLLLLLLTQPTAMTVDLPKAKDKHSRPKN
jgi:hypothetical protein